MTNLTELKAQAYDLIANIEFLQEKLTQVNNQITKIAKEQKENGANDLSSHS